MEAGGEIGDSRSQTGYIFLSYARADGEFVDRLADDLVAAHVPLWRDIWNIEAGTNWSSAIDLAVRQAAGLIYVSSKNSVASPWMQEELKAMLAQAGMRVFPVVLDDVGAERMPALLRDVQWADFRLDDTTAFERLVEGIALIVPLSGTAEDRTELSKGYVFLSYCDEDARFVVGLRGFLKDRSYAYWDYRESERDYHGQLSLELEDIIQEAAATLSVYSPSWKLSNWTIKEFLFSSEVGTPVFLLRVRDPGPTLVTAGIPYIDFVEATQDGFERLDRELRRKGLLSDE